MKVAHHALELFNVTDTQIREAILNWFTDTGFKVIASKPEFRIHARRGSAIGITDRQTSRTMEVIIKSTGDFTAVSIYHHTERFGPLIGVTFGELLRDEVNALRQFLGDTRDKNR